MRVFGNLKKAHKAPSRVLLLGFSGISFSLLKKLCAAGHLPQIARLLDAGFACEMETGVPPDPAVVWTTCFTGANPGRHGMFGFVDRRRQSYGVYFPNAAQIAAPAVWDALGSAGKTTIAVNIPQTYPAREINGIMIAGPVADDFERAIHPRRLIEPLRAVDYRIDVPADVSPEMPEALCSELAAVLKKQRETFLSLARKTRWDLFFGVFACTRYLAQYYAGHLRDPDSPYYDRLCAFLRELDGAVAGLEEVAGDDAALLLVSDCGYADCVREVHLNALLAQQGLLHFLKDPPASFDDIDPDRTKAFVLDPGRVYINQKGVMPKGCIAAGQEYERVLKTLIEIFIGLKEPATGSAVISRIFRRHELYEGPLIAKAPDLVLAAAPGYDLKGDIAVRQIFTESGTGSMRTSNDAFFYLRGSNGLAAKPSIRDIAPTILTLFRLPVPKEMAGKSLI